MTNEDQSRHLLLLGGGEMQIEAFNVARRSGLRTVCVDPNPNAQCRSLADHFYAADLADLQALLAIAEQHAIDGVLTLAADYPMPALADLCARLGLRGPSREAVATVCDKARLRQATASRFVTTPRWRECTRSTVDHGLALLEHSTCIVKPADSSGGRGVTQLTSASTAKEVQAALEAAFAMSRAGRILVEEFVEGPEFSVESLTFNRMTETVAVTEKFTSGSPFFFETGHVVPATLTATQLDSIRPFIAQVVAATGLDNCATHLELKLGPDGPVLIEIAGRLGGGFINTDLVPLATGVDMIKAAIDIALGRRPDLRARRNAAAAIRFLIPPPGVLVGVDGIDAVKGMAGIHRIVCEYGLGDTIPVVRDATGRKAYLICKGDNPLEVKLLATRAAEKIAFRMKQHE